jgi:opacity protein-like surface antigen
MARLAALVVALAGFAACGLGAHAADMPGRYRPPAPASEPLAPTAGWYLRGDIGYRWHQAARADVASGFPTPGVNDLQGGFWGGIGAGFKRGPLRIDVTVDHGAAVGYRGTALTAGDVRASVRATTVLANAYYDIGTWAGFTPYIGAGIGPAYVRLSDYQSAVTPPLTPVPAFARWNVAWGVMGGLSYQITPALAVDGGYRYLELGTIESASDPTGRFSLMGVAAHEFRIGLRWTYGDLVSSIR